MTIDEKHIKDFLRRIGRPRLAPTKYNYYRELRKRAEEWPDRERLLAVIQDWNEEEY